MFKEMLSVGLNQMQLSIAGVQQNKLNISNEIKDQIKEIDNKLKTVQKQILEVKQETGELTKNVNKMGKKPRKADVRTSWWCKNRCVRRKAENLR